MKSGKLFDKKKLKKKALEPLVTFRQVKQHMAYFCYPTMGNYFNDENWEWHWRPSLMVCFMFICMVLIGIDCYLNRHDWMHLVFATTLIPYAIMGFERVLLVNNVRKPFFAMYITMERYIEKWEQDPEIFPIFQWYCRVAKWIVYGCSVSFIGGGFLFVTVSVLIYYVVTGKMEVVIPIYIPNMDYNSHPGFEIHVVAHTYLAFLAETGYSVFINSMIVVLIMACAEADVIIQKEEKLHGMLEKNSKDKKIEKLLKEIYELHQDLLKLVDNIEHMWSIQQLTDHIIFGAQIILILYIVLQQFWLPGYLMIAAAMFIIFAIDLLGTLVEVKLDKLSIATYDVSWYLLSVKNQKDYNYFLQATQKTARLTLRSGPPLNLDTFVRFCKGIYSYLMVLRETT
ncbi:odorant receptor 67d-like [Culicoides brevitarsis]|uniref:odorant receptor 67d-like n=1 Tax=Culicoides brevitarsis TaxID=469753 RepID=UPI00307B2800